MDLQAMMHYMNLTNGQAGLKSWRGGKVRKRTLRYRDSFAQHL